MAISYFPRTIQLDTEPEPINTQYRQHNSTPLNNNLWKISTSCYVLLMWSLFTKFAVWMFYSEDEKMSGVRWAQHHGAGRRPPGSGCRETDARGPARSAAAGRARCGHAAPRSAPARSSWRWSQDPDHQSAPALRPVNISLYIQRSWFMDLWWIENKRQDINNWPAKDRYLQYVFIMMKVVRIQGVLWLNSALSWDKFAR